MKINPDYRLMTVGGKRIIVSENCRNLKGIPTLNETAEFIWHMAEKGAEAEEIVQSLADECGVSQDKIRDEVLDFIDKLKRADIIE